jgi:phenylacetate-CoA ligase
MDYTGIGRFVKLSASVERAAWDIYERLPIPLRHKVFYGPAFPRWTALLKESENWDDKRLRVYQFEQTKRLLRHSMKHVPYYRKLFGDIGFQPDRMQSIDDIKILPYLSKERVRDGGMEHVDESIPPRSLVRKPTGGSSGIPLTVYKTRESNAAFLAFRENILGRIGHIPRAREVMLWHYIKLGGKDLCFTKYGNRLVLSMQYLTSERLMQYMDMIKDFQPEFILGYPSWLTILSYCMAQHKLSPFSRTKAVIAYSETLPSTQRKLLEESFNCRVFSMFGMNEHAAIGGECEKSAGIHFHPLYGLIEFADAVGGYKEIVATGFTNFAMPLVRYRTGDLVTEHSGSCRHCGRHHKVVATIEGRVHEFLVDKDYALIDIRPLLIAAFPNVLQCQFYQDRPGKVLLKIVPSRAFSANDGITIKKQFSGIMGPRDGAMDMELLIVDEIQRSSAGKIVMIEQKLDLRGSFN